MGGQSMRILGWMITRMVLARFFLIVLGISTFVVTLDMVSFARDILELKGNNLSAKFPADQFPPGHFAGV
jgi:hypothetical protein